MNKKYANNNSQCNKRHKTGTPTSESTKHITGKKTNNITCKDKISLTKTYIHIGPATCPSYCSSSASSTVPPLPVKNFSKTQTESSRLDKSYRKPSSPTEREHPKFFPKKRHTK